MGDDRAEPVAVGAQLDDVGTSPPQIVELALRLFDGCIGEATLHGVRDANLAPSTGRRIGDGHETDRWHIAFTGIVDRDGQQVVAQPEPGERVGPLGPPKSAITVTKPRRLLSRATRSMAPARSLWPRCSDEGGDATFVRIART